MKRFIKIITYIPLVNFLSFFLLAIPIPFIYNMKKEEYFKGGIKLLFGMIIYVILINIFSFESEIANTIVFVILVYILGLYFSFVVLQCIVKVEERHKSESSEYCEN